MSGFARAGWRLRIVGLRTGQAAWQGLVAFSVRDNLTYAASIAYYALLSLFPLLLLVTSLLGAATADDAERTLVLRFVLRYFPDQFQFLAAQLDAMRASRVTLGLGGTIGLLWGALGVFGAVSTAVNYAWGVERRRSYWRHKLMSFLMLIVAGVVLLATLLLVSASHVVQATWFAQVVAHFPGLAVLHGLAIRSVTTLMFIAVVGFVYYFVPNTQVRFREVWAGAVVAGLLWKGAFELFSWYVRGMSRWTAVNGSIAAVVVFLVWVYVQAVILLYGVEFTAAYARLRRTSGDAPAESADGGMVS